MKESRYLKIFGPRQIPLQNIYSRFSEFGNVEFACYADPSEICAIVAFMNIGTALMAIKHCQEVNGIPITVDFCDHSVICEMDGGYDLQETRFPKDDKCAILVGGLPPFRTVPISHVNVNDYHVIASKIKRQLTSALEKYGKVDNMRCFSDKSGLIRCIVTFNRYTDCASFLSKTHLIKIYESVLTFEGCHADDYKNEDHLGDIDDETLMEASRTLYISNIHERTTRDDLWDHFSKYGHIITVDSSRMPLYAFIQFASISSVVRAMTAGRVDYMWGRRLKLNFGKTLQWKMLWVKINGHFNKNDVIDHIKRFSRPERFHIDWNRSEMLVWFRRTDDAVYTVKKLREHPTDGEFFILIDFSSDKMDSYFFYRGDIDTVCDSKYDKPTQRETSYDSSIGTCESSGGNTLNRESIHSSLNASLNGNDKLVVVDTCDPVLDKVEKFYNTIHSQLSHNISVPRDFSSTLMNSVISCLRSTNTLTRPPSPHLDTSLMTLEDNQSKQKVNNDTSKLNSENVINVASDMHDSEEKVKVVKEDPSKFARKYSNADTCTVSDNMSVSDDSFIDKKVSHKIKRTSEYSSDFLNDLFVPDNVLPKNGGSKQVRPEIRSHDKDSETNENLETKHEQNGNIPDEIIKNDSDILRSDVRNEHVESVEDDDFSLPKRQKKRISNVCIDSDDDNKIGFDVYNDIVANAVKDVGISMYDSIKIRRIYGDCKKQETHLPMEYKSRKRKYSSDSSCHMSSVEDVPDSKEKTEVNVWNTDIMVNGCEEAKMEVIQNEVVDVKEESELVSVSETDPKQPIVKGVQISPSSFNGSKKKKSSKVKISVGLSRVLKNNVKFLRNHEASKMIPTKDVVTNVSVKDETVEDTKEPELEENVKSSTSTCSNYDKSDSDSTITVVHPEDSIRSPARDEECPGPPIIFPNNDSQQTSQSSDPTLLEFVANEQPEPNIVECPPVNQMTTQMGYPQSYVYSNIPVSLKFGDLQQFYYQQPSIYISPVDMMRPQTRFVHPNGYVYETFPQQTGNYCLQPISLIQRPTNIPFDYSLIPANFLPVQYVSPCGQSSYVQRMSNDNSLLCQQSVRIQQPYLSDVGYYMSVPNIPTDSQSKQLPGSEFQTPTKDQFKVTSIREVKILNGSLFIKKAAVKVEYHYISGKYSLAERIMHVDRLIVPDLYMTQRMRLVQSQFDEVEKRLKIVDNWCCFAVIPKKEADNLSIFRTNFIQYLSTKNVAGIVSYNTSKERTDELFPVIYFVPPSEFGSSLLKRWTSEDNIFRFEKDIFVAIVCDK